MSLFQPLWQPAATTAAETTAAVIPFTPSGTIAATTLQTALEELDTEKLAVADIDDAPVNGVTNAPISSNWAYDHLAVTHSPAESISPLYHGFVNRTDSTLAFDNSSHIITLGVATTTKVYLAGVPYTISSPGLTLDLDTKTLANGLWFVWIEISGGVPVLNAAQATWSILNTAIIPCVTVYWNGAAGAVCDERHGANRNLALHAYLHLTEGARVQNDGSFAQTRPSTTNDSTLQLVGGSLWDEDIENVITTAQGKLCRNWYETASGVWTFADGTDNGGYDRPYLWNSGTSRVQFPKSDNAYALADGSNANYIPVWVYASNDISRPIYIVTPSLTAGYTTIANARAATAPVVLFAAEVKLLYRWIYRGDGEYQEAADYRTSSSLPSGGISSPVAAAVSFSPSGNIVATNVQAAIEELDTQQVAEVIAAAVSFSPSGNIVATNVQAAIEELAAVEELDTQQAAANYLAAIALGALI